jgi:hypothetical protein
LSLSPKGVGPFHFPPGFTRVRKVVYGYLKGGRLATRRIEFAKNLIQVLEMELSLSQDETKARV